MTYPTAAKPVRLTTRSAREMINKTRPIQYTFVSFTTDPSGVDPDPSLEKNPNPVLIHSLSNLSNLDRGILNLNCPIGSGPDTTFLIRN